MIPVQNYGLHEYQGNTWLVQSAYKNESAVGLPPTPVFSATPPVHPRSLTVCPHAYNLEEPEPTEAEFYTFMTYVNENPILRYFLPRTHKEHVMPLLTMGYADVDVMWPNIELLLSMHPSIEPFLFPMQHFDQANRNIAIEAARTNLLPIVINGFTPMHIRKLGRYATSLLMAPRTVIIACPLQVFGPPPFKLFPPGCLASLDFTKFLSDIDIRRVGTHYLRRFMRGEL